MQRNTNLILAISLLVVAFCLYLAAPAHWFVKEGDPKPIFPDSGIVLGLDLQGGASIEFAPDWTKIADKQEAKALQANPKTLDDIVEITQQRIDIYGLQEMKVRRAENRIRVELPGADQARAQEIIDLVEQAGRLEFQIVADDALAKKYPQSAGKAPSGYAWVPYKANEAGVVSAYELLKVDDNYRMTGSDLSDARVGPDEFGKNLVLFDIRAQSQQTFGSLTGDNLGKQMAIVLDGHVQSAPSIEGQIVSNGQISGGQGGFAMAEAQRIVTVLKSGRLPVPLKAENQNVIGPSLGADAIQAGIIAGVVGTTAVVLIMCLYYFGMGVLSTIGLVVAMALVVGVLAFFNATLTLSGIAGLVLTLGMAVDANVLIYERIREERNRGLGPIEAINEGFNRATETILDANITTLLTAFILYLVGQGPVQGFAITLSAGIIASVLASLFTTRALFSWFADRGVLRELKMLNVIGTPTVSYTSKIKMCAVISAVTIVAGFGLFVSRGTKNLGLDFASGTLVQFALSKPMPIDQVRSRLAAQESTRADGTKFRPYANAEIVEVHADMTTLGSDASKFNLRTEITNSKAVRADVEKVFASELASSGFEELQRQGEGVGWTQVYALRIPQKFDSLYKEVSGAWEAEADRVEAAGNPRPVYSVERDGDPETEVRVKRIRVTMEKRPLREGETEAAIEADLKRMADKVKDTLKKSYLDPATEFVERESVDQTFTVRLPCAFRTPVSESVLRKVLTAAAYAKGEVQLETKDADKSQLPGANGAPETHVARTVFVLTGLSGVSTKGAALEGLLREGFRKEGVLLSDPFPQITKIDPVVAGELQRRGAQALLMAVFVILLYVGIRFRAGAADTQIEAGGFIALCRDVAYRARFGIAAIVAIVHDVLFSLGAIAAADQFGLIEAKIDLPMLAALLAIVGYSLNDSIVVFDRVRENLRRSPDMPLRELIDLSINQTMSRTIMTSLTTLVAVTALLVFGAGSTRGFAFAMLCGVGVGTYSSIFIASPMLLFWEKRGPQSSKPAFAGAGGPAPLPAPKPEAPAPAPDAPAAAAPEAPAEGGDAPA